MKLKLDLMDEKILDILQENVAVTMAGIDRHIHLNQPAVTERRAIKLVS